MQKMNRHSGTATIAGKKYPCEVNKDGVPFIDGKTVDEFMKTLTPDELVQCAMVGGFVMDDVINKDTKPRSPQRMMNELHQSKNN